MNKYLNWCYSALMGKLIGIRLGAPVENMTAEQIHEKYPVISEYLVDYGIFAADDDSNGPLFFSRPLLEISKSELTAQDVANAILGYICDGEGFFWWGGKGISTEDTAYQNLKSGIKPPASGSVAVNGQTLAEQIGGQIFSDCWGYASAGNPGEAARLAALASSVTHDRNGIEGGKFVAAATALTYRIKDAKAVVKEALEYLDNSLEYSAVVKDIIRFYESGQGTWRDCFAYIQQNYGYDKYPGVCHIIPNTAIMILALFYGENDFSNTLTMLCACGWDTDCTCGNVGSIMGGICGIEKISEHWIRPINDIIVCSSAVGFLNNQTAAEAARAFAKMNFGKKETRTDKTVWRFELPYETCGFFEDGNPARQSDGSLLFNRGRKMYKYTYFMPGDLYDARYEPSFSPIVYPGETLGFTVSAQKATRCRGYIEYADGESFFGEWTEVGCNETEISLKIPGSGRTVRIFGIEREGEVSMRLCRAYGDKKADFAPEFVVDSYPGLYNGGNMPALRGFVKYSGGYSVNSKTLTVQGGMVTTGDIGFADYTLELEAKLISGSNLYAIVCFRNAGNFFACGLSGENVQIVEYRDFEPHVLAQFHQNDFNSTNFFTIKVECDKITLGLKGLQLEALNIESDKLCGGVGFLAEKDSCGDFSCVHFKSNAFLG